MFDLFAAAPQELRQHQLQEYGEYLRQRDGELDMTAWTLAKREKSLAKYEGCRAISRGRP